MIIIMRYFLTLRVIKPKVKGLGYYFNFIKLKVKGKVWLLDFTIANLNSMVLFMILFWVTLTQAIKLTVAVVIIVVVIVKY
jgi:hypothetical protein